MSVMWGLGVVAVVIVAIVLSARASRALVAVEVVGDRIVVRPLGLHKLWSLRGQIEVAAADVVDVHVLPQSGPPRGFRAPGTSLPGVLYAGTFRKGRAKAFWLVRGSTRPALVIETSSGRPYNVIVVGVPDPETVASQLLGILPTSPRSTRTTRIAAE